MFPSTLRQQIIISYSLTDFWETVCIPGQIREAAEINPIQIPH